MEKEEQMNIGLLKDKVEQLVIGMLTLKMKGRITKDVDLL
jgi:hypothetical protein